jgi:hypothetical protein
MTRRPTAPPRRGRRRKKLREPSPFCSDPRQLDLIEYVARKDQRAGFAKLDAAIEKALQEDEQ